MGFRVASAFTLVELLLVLAIVSLLAGLLLPALGRTRAAARTAQCLTQIKTLEQAHTLYLNDFKEYFIDAALAHGGLGDAKSAWPVTLAAYVGGPLVLRSPVDRSAAWPEGEGGQSADLGYRAFLTRSDAGRLPVPGNPRLARWTSYGLNNYTTRSKQPPREVMRQPAYDRMALIPRPAATVHFLMMTQTTRRGASDFTRSDHVHAETWSDAGESAAPATAAGQMDVAAHGGSATSAGGLANYGFLDGHAATHRFAEVYQRFTSNRFDPEIAR